MNKKYLIFIIMTLLVLTLTLALSGCGRDNNELEGKYIATFELNGGTLDILTSSTNTKINFAYYPGTYIIDPAEIPGYKLFKNGYVFTGWYTSPECKPEEKWDFESTLFNTETLTLYAGWEKAIVYSFTLYYVDGEKDVELGKYTVSAGEKLDDWRKFAENREGYTPLGYFADRNFTSPWNNKTVHPGGEADLDIPVYVNYIKGDWALVSDHASLGKAVSAGKNVYLLNDIDCHNEELNFDDTYSGVFEGNNYKVSNFTVKKSGSALKPGCSIFNDLGDTAKISNVSFDNVTYELFDVPSNAREVEVAALAKYSDGAIVENVTVKGKIVTNYEGEFPSLCKAFYEEDSTGEVNGFTANITVEKQTQ